VVIDTWAFAEATRTSGARHTAAARSDRVMVNSKTFTRPTRRPA
jgi:hypothetical protein